MIKNLFTLLRVIFGAVVSLLRGFLVTMKYWVKPKTTFTLQYPFEKRNVFEGYRGLLFCDIEVCDGCAVCARECPVDCIEVEAMGKGKWRKPKYFNIRMDECMFCAICVDVCPRKCLVFTDVYAFAAERADELYFRFLTPQKAQEFEKEIKAAETAKPS